MPVTSLCHHVRRARCIHGRMHCACFVPISLKLVLYYVECALPDGEPRALFSLSLQTPPTPYSSTTSHKVMTRSLSQRPLDTGRSSALPRSPSSFGSSGPDSSYPQGIRVTTQSRHHLPLAALEREIGSSIPLVNQGHRGYQVRNSPCDNIPIVSFR